MSQKQLLIELLKREKKMSNRIEIETKYDIERKTNSSKFDPTAITVKSLTATGDFMIAQKTMVDRVIRRAKK